MKDKFKKATTASTERQKAILRRWAFNLFLKSVMSETVRRKSAGREREREREREFHAAGPEMEKCIYY